MDVIMERKQNRRVQKSPEEIKKIKEINAGKAREGFEGRWDRLVDPEGTLSPEEKLAAIEVAKHEHYVNMAARSVEVRKSKGSTVKERLRVAEFRIDAYKKFLAKCYKELTNIEDMADIARIQEKVALIKASLDEVYDSSGDQ